MGLRRGFKSEAEDIAVEVRAELGLSALAVLDPLVLAAHLEIPVRALTECDYDQDLIDHFTGVGQDTFSAVTVFHGHRRVIVHNDSHARQRQNSNIVHELSHALLLHPPSAALDIRGCRVWDQDHEDEADYLCGCLLVTRRAALQVARRGFSLDAAAAHFGVSRQMMAWRVNGTGAQLQAQRELAARRKRASRKS
jgi:Zn-dependent peptidase ImmA (M78 family)